MPIATPISTLRQRYQQAKAVLAQAEAHHRLTEAAMVAISANPTAEALDGRLRSLVDQLAEKRDWLSRQLELVHAEQRKAGAADEKCEILSRFLEDVYDETGA